MVRKETSVGALGFHYLIVRAGTLVDEYVVDYLRHDMVYLLHVRLHILVAVPGGRLEFLLRSDVIRMQNRYGKSLGEIQKEAEAAGMSYGMYVARKGV